MTQHELDVIDRAIITATQSGLPLVPRPYHAIASQVGVEPDEVIARLKAMIASGVIRRIGVVPNHFALGLDRNAMTVWDVDDADINRLGREVGGLDFVSHCYHRPRMLPTWPYNLFAMVHGRTDEEVASKIAIVTARLGASCHSSDVLLSKRILKKTGLRLAA